MSMSIMICLVCLNILTEGIMLFLGECVLFICVDLAFVCVWYVDLYFGWVVSLAYCHVVVPKFDFSHV